MAKNHVINFSDMYGECIDIEARQESWRPYDPQLPFKRGYNEIKSYCVRQSKF